MNRYILFDNQVELMLSDVSDGNMKVVPTMEPSEIALARQNRLKALKAIGLSGSSTALVRVSYELDDFCKFTALDAPGGYCIDNDLDVPFSDGLLTTVSELGLLLPLADCLGVVLYNAQHHALMMVHCGRHTLLQEGALKAVRFMEKQVGARPTKIHSWFSPCAGKENYPLFEAQNKSLQELAHEQLVQAGLSVASIQLSSLDTTTSSDFYSHSQGDTLNRFAICAKLCAQT